VGGILCLLDRVRNDAHKVFCMFLEIKNLHQFSQNDECVLVVKHVFPIAPKGIEYGPLESLPACKRAVLVEVLVELPELELLLLRIHNE